MDDATFQLGNDRTKAGHLVSRKNDIRFELAINPWQAPMGACQGLTQFILQTRLKIRTGSCGQILIWFSYFPHSSSSLFTNAAFTSSTYLNGATRLRADIDCQLRCGAPIST